MRDTEGEVDSGTTVSVIQRLVTEEATISEVALGRVRRPPLFFERADLTHDDRELLDRALNVRSETGMPYPDAVGLMTCRAGTVSQTIFQVMGVHRSTQICRWVARDEILTGKVLQEIANEEGTDEWAITSRIRLVGGEEAHMPMLDFRIPTSSDALEKVEQVLLEMDAGPGWILDSGRSYHFLGRRVLRQVELFKFLGKAMLYRPITDGSWLAHQVIEGVCSLRLSNHSTSKFGPPRVVAGVTFSL